MGETLAALVFDLFETVEVELPDEAFKFAVAEEDRNDIPFHFLRVQDVNHCASSVPGDH